MKRLGWLASCSLFLAAPAFAQSSALLEAERAYQGVDFPATHTLAERALEAGRNTRAETARIYVLLGISAAAQGNTEEAKRDFVVALAVEPGLKLDRGLSPKIREPYLEAQGYWAAASERLSLSARPANDAQHLILHLVDPASLVAKVELRIAAVGVLPRPQFEVVVAPVSRFALPSTLRGHDYEYALRALDRHGNVLVEQGSDADPQFARYAATSPSAPPLSAREPLARSYLLPVALGVAGLSAAVAGVVLHVRREQAAQDWNGPGCESPGQTRIEQCHAVDSRRESSERLAIGFYAAGGALLTGSVLSFILGKPSDAERDPQRAGLLGCSPVGAGMSCVGRF